MKHLVCTKYR